MRSMISGNSPDISSSLIDALSFSFRYILFHETPESHTILDFHLPSAVLPLSSRPPLSGTDTFAPLIP